MCACTHACVFLRVSYAWVSVVYKQFSPVLSVLDDAHLLRFQMFTKHQLLQHFSPCSRCLPEPGGLSPVPIQSPVPIVFLGDTGP